MLFVSIGREVNMHAVECDRVEQAFRKHPKTGGLVPLHQLGGCTQLYLTNARRGDDLASALADAMPENTELRTLWIDGNGITDAGMLSFASGLLQNKALMKFSARSNPATNPRDDPGKPEFEAVLGAGGWTYDGLYWVKGDVPTHPIHKKVRAQMENRNREKRAAAVAAARRLAARNDL
jgi:hypothetical protein